MKFKIYFWLIMFFTIGICPHVFAQSFGFLDLDEQCTIGVASAKATADGRPLLWKTRDNSSSLNNEVIYNSSYSHKFVSVVTAGGTSSWMGVNNKGFAIVNAVSSDLAGGSTGPGNGELMKIVLGTCATIDEFQDYLDRTNASGRSTQANFAVIDAAGGAAIYEASATEYWKFDANDSTVAPSGYVLRTNFAFNGDAKYGLNDNIYSIERYRRQRDLIADFLAGDTLNYMSILRFQMRDFSDFDSDPVPVPFPDRWLSYRPYGYIYADVSICRTSSVSAAVIQGVLPDESAKLSTMWTMLGQPAAAISVPYWPVGSTPSEANGSSTAPLCNAAKQIRTLLFDYPENSSYIDSYKLRDETGAGLWATIFPAEDSIFAAVQTNLEEWRVQASPEAEMLQCEKGLASYALRVLKRAYTDLTTDVIQVDEKIAVANNFVLSQNYPNPFNASTIIQFYVPKNSSVSLTVYNINGETVANLCNHNFEPGWHTVNYQPQQISSGIYFYRIETYSQNDDQNLLNSNTKKLHYLK